MFFIFAIDNEGFGGLGMSGLDEDFFNRFPDEARADFNLAVEFLFEKLKNIAGKLLRKLNVGSADVLRRQPDTVGYFLRIKILNRSVKFYNPFYKKRFFPH